MLGKFLKEKFAFTLIELMVVITVMGILAYLSLPTFEMMIIRNKEKVLRQTLHDLRQGIDYFYIDNGFYPVRWSQLRYYKGVAYYREAPPINPFTPDPYDWWVISSGVYDNSAYLPASEQTIKYPGLPYKRFFMIGLKFYDGTTYEVIHKVPNESGIWDVRYPREDVALDGTLYCDW